MNRMPRLIEKPKRWDQPFADNMSEAAVAELLSREPFAGMRRESFPPSIPLSGILQNDCRIREFQPNELIIRQGDYGNSAFLILDGQVLASLRPWTSPKPNSINSNTKLSNWQALAQLWNRPKHPEVRQIGGDQAARRSYELRQEGDTTRVFVQDIPGTMDLNQSQTLRAGSIFGELSALARSPRVANVISQTCSKLLEIRWQGLRELMKYDPALKGQIDRLYRQNGLKSHLAETPLLKALPQSVVEEIASATEFESYGEYLWTSTFRKCSETDIANRIQAEPVIAQQGDYLNGLMLVRSGFVRVSRQHGDGEQTIEYLGKGQVCGLRELYHNWKHNEQRPWQLTYRAVGYVDILWIPVEVAEAKIFPQLPRPMIPAALPEVNPTTGNQRRLASRQPNLETRLLESIVEHRLMNGTEAMVIDLNRCTRCDDCVRACADAHAGNPRFVRDGLVLGQWMFAAACMHCLDPVCMIGCPTGAIGRETESGVVTINSQTCIGCGTCANNCPYGTIKMVATNDTNGAPVLDQSSGLPVLQATKCDLCVRQLGGPACQRACPHDALVRIDLTHPADLTQWISG